MEKDFMRISRNRALRSLALLVLTVLGVVVLTVMEGFYIYYLIVIACVSLYCVWSGFLPFLRGDLVKTVKDFCRNTDNPAETMAQLEKVWSSKAPTKTLRMDYHYLLWVTRGRVAIFSVPELYEITCKSRGSVFYGGRVKTPILRVVALDGRIVTNYVTRQEVQAITRHLKKHPIKLIEE